MSSFFPRCYDLADLKQSADFLNDFYQTACFSIIKIVATHLTTKNDKLLSFYNEYMSKVAEYSDPWVFKMKFKNMCISMDNPKRN